MCQLYYTCTMCIDCTETIVQTDHHVPLASTVSTDNARSFAGKLRYVCIKHQFAIGMHFVPPTWLLCQRTCGKSLRIYLNEVGYTSITSVTCQPVDGLPKQDK